MAATTNLSAVAAHFRSLHQSSNPIILTNTHDKASTEVVAALPQTRAVATASYAIAETLGLGDPQLDLEANLKGIAAVREGLRSLGSRGDELPLTADLQDCYEDPAETIRRAIEVGGIVGCNIEDLDNDPTEKRKVRLRSPEEAADRVRAVLRGAKEAGVEGFVVNARTDVLGFGGTIDDVISRGKNYLDAGATAVFVWGCGKHDITVAEAKRMSEAFGGRLSLQPGVIGVKGCREAGACRVSVGPLLWRKIQGVDEQDREAVFKKEALAVYES